MKYDQLFRQTAAVNLELLWHKCEPDIWLMAVMDPAGPPSTRPASQQGQCLAQHSTMQCRRWYKGSCMLPQCRFRHVFYVL